MRGFFSVHRALAPLMVVVLWVVGQVNLATLDLLSLLLAAGAMAAIFRFKVGVLTVLGGCALLGVLASLVFF